MKFILFLIFPILSRADIRISPWLGSWRNGSSTINVDACSKSKKNQLLCHFRLFSGLQQCGDGGALKIKKNRATPADPNDEDSALVTLELKNNQIGVIGGISDESYCHYGKEKYSLVSTTKVVSPKPADLNCENIQYLGVLRACTDPILAGIFPKIVKNTSLKEAQQSLQSGLFGDSNDEAISYLMSDILKKLRPDLAADVLKEESFLDRSSLSFDDSSLGTAEGEEWSLELDHCKNKMCDYTYELDEVDTRNDTEPPTVTDKFLGRAQINSATEIELLAKDPKQPNCVLVLKENSLASKEAVPCKNEFAKMNLEFKNYTPSQIFKTSFDCLSPKLNPIETTICHSSELASLDIELNSVFQRAKKEKKAQELTNSQKQWIQSRETCQNSVYFPDIYCLKFFYRKRLLDFYDSGVSVSK